IWGKLEKSSQHRSHFVSSETPHHERMQLFLLLLLLLSQFPYATMQTKCSLKMAIEGLKEFNFQKPGDYLITGITSKIISQFYPYVFSKPPTYRLRRILVIELTLPNIKIIVCQLDFHATAMLLTVIIVHENKNIFIEGKVWIATTLSKLSIRMFSNKLDLQRKHVLFSFFTQANRRQYYNFNSYYSSEKEFVKEVFQCSYSKPLWSKKVWERCTEKESRLLPPVEVLDRMIIEDGSSISRAIHAVASVLSAAASSQLSKRRVLVGDHQSSPIVQPWQDGVEMRYEETEIWIENYGGDGVETCMAYKQGRTVLMTENELTFSLKPKERVKWFFRK
ncbi:hypothetical protein E2320_014574, partial [Naja naja]